MQESTKIMESKIELFNKNHPVGSDVFVIKDNGDKVKTQVKYPACIMGEHTAVAWLDGIIGAWALDRIYEEYAQKEYVPTTDIEDSDFGCPHCAGMGYMDFPSNQKPCPIPGHLERYQSNLKILNKQMGRLKRKWSAIDGPCPYCKKEEECEHWTGLGWTKQVSNIV